MNQGSSGELELRGLRKAYGSFNAVDGVDLRVREGEFVSLLGPSGCGKTTILRIVAGLIEPDSGQILLGGDDITRRAVHRRNVGLVFQSYALSPTSMSSRTSPSVCAGEGWRAPSSRQRGAFPRTGTARSARGALPARAFRRPATARGSRARLGNAPRPSSSR